MVRWFRWAAVLGAALALASCGSPGLSGRPTVSPAAWAEVAQSPSPARVPTATSTPTPTPSPTSTRPYSPRPRTAFPRTLPFPDEGTPYPSETPTPIPLTEDEALEGYRQWVANATSHPQEYWFLRDLAPGAQVFSTRARLVRLDAAAARAVVEDRLYYRGFGWTPSGQGEYDAYIPGLFVMERRPSGEWVLVEVISPTPVPTPPPPTRDPNAPTPRGWTREDAAQAAWHVYERINYWRQVNGLSPLAYEWAWQEAANEIAAVLHEKGAGPFEWDADAAPILARYGIDRKSVCLDGGDNIPIVVTIGRGCSSGDCLDIYAHSYRTNPLLTQARYTRVVVGFYGPYAGPGGPSITVIIIGGG
ncbi:MAG: hypothetical protein ACP5NB_11280 [Chloroflexia bacterium]